MIMKPIMSVDEARKILGKTAVDMSDEELEKLIDDLDALAHAYIESYKRGEIEIPNQKQKS